MADISKKEVDKFVRLMLEILSNPQLNADYIINPRGILDKYKISEPVKEVVLSGDMARIQKMFSDAGFSGDGRQMVHI